MVHVLLLLSNGNYWGFLKLCDALERTENVVLNIKCVFEDVGLYLLSI